MAPQYGPFIRGVQGPLGSALADGAVFCVPERLQQIENLILFEVTEG